MNKRPSFKVSRSTIRIPVSTRTAQKEEVKPIQNKKKRNGSAKKKGKKSED